MFCSLFLEPLLGSGILFIIKILLMVSKLLITQVILSHRLSSFCFFSPHCMTASNNISGEGWEDNVVRERSLRLNERGFIFILGNVSWSPSPGISAALALVWSWTGSTPESHGCYWEMLQVQLLDAEGTSGGWTGDEECCESELEAGVCLCDGCLGPCNTVNPMSSESTSWDPRNHEADFKTMFSTKKSIIFSLLSAILILQSACGNLSFKLFLFPQVFDQ